jgi:RNA binding exosome subunit
MMAVPFVSSKAPIGYIEVRVFAHATEDEAKVIAAVKNTLPEELQNIVPFQKSSLSGHHGNPISVIEGKILDKPALPLVLDKIGRGLGSLDKEMLEREIKLHLDKRNLFLRFDKQAAYLGELRFSSIDPIHFRIHFKNKASEEIMDILRKSGLLP